MKRTKLVFNIIALILLFSCENTKENAVIASNKMIADIIYDNNRIVEYFYEPVDGKYHVFFELSDESGKMIKDKNGNWPRYSGADFLEKFIETKNRYGVLNKFDIIEIKYKYDFFPFYDYGYPYGIEIELECFYENGITTEYIHGYYIKEIDKINIVSYNIKNH
jgi:hypothetical protein